jgi:predicted RNase H-like nuclease (RuvC/YqgF family)
MMRYSLAGALVVAGLVLAFIVGRLAVTADRTSSSRPSVSASSEPVDVQTAEERAAQTDRLQELEKQVASLKKENAELKSDRADLQSKLSSAADTVNKMQASLHEANRRAEEAEWRARQIGPPAGPSVPLGAGSP